MDKRDSALVMKNTISSLKHLWWQLNEVLGVWIVPVNVSYNIVAHHLPAAQIFNIYFIVMLVWRKYSLTSVTQFRYKAVTLY